MGFQSITKGLNGGREFYFDGRIMCVYQNHMLIGYLKLKLHKNETSFSQCISHSIRLSFCNP